MFLINPLMIAVATPIMGNDRARSKWLLRACAHIQRVHKWFEKHSYKLEPGRVRLSSEGTAETNFSQPSTHHLVNLCACVAASSRQVELKVARWTDSLRRSFWCCHRRCVRLQDLRPVKRLSGVPLTATLVTRTTAPSTTTVPTVAPFRGTARLAPSGTTVRNTTVRGSNIYCHKAWSF